MNEPTEELYGIRHHNEETLLTKNVLTVYLPISAAVYMSCIGMDVAYLSVERGSLRLGYRKFEDLLGVGVGDLKKIRWASADTNPAFTASKKSPGYDMVPMLDGRVITELEIKLTVVPTYYSEKVTEMIIRQNTQFNFAERLCYYYGDDISTPVTREVLGGLVRKCESRQKPFIVQGIWKTQGQTPLIDKQKALDVLIISDMAYLKMLIDSNQTKTAATGADLATRIGRVLDHLTKWLNEFKTKGTITYKEEHEGSKDHLKITLYIVDHLEELRGFLWSPRLNFTDLLKILPLPSISKLSPERRLDQSIVHTLMQERNRTAPGR